MNSFRWLTSRMRIAAIVCTVLAVTALVWNASQAGPASASTLAEQWLDHVQYTWSLSTSLGDLLTETASISQIRIDSIDGPKWNSSDGRAWSGDVSTPAEVYSTVRGHLENVWAGQAPGAEIELTVLGDAARRFEGDHPPPYAQISGGFAVGESFVVLLRRATFAYEDGIKTSWTVNKMFEGNWRVDSDRAIGSRRDRSMSLAGLRQSLGAIGLTVTHTSP